MVGGTRTRKRASFDLPTSSGFVTSAVYACSNHYHSMYPPGLEPGPPFRDLCDLNAATLPRFVHGYSALKWWDSNPRPPAPLTHCAMPALYLTELHSRLFGQVVLTTLCLSLSPLSPCLFSLLFTHPACPALTRLTVSLVSPMRRYCVCFLFGTPASFCRVLNTGFRRLSSPPT